VGFKDLLVTLDPTDLGQERLRVATRLAQRHRAHLFGYYAFPTAGYIEGPGSAALADGMPAAAVERASGPAGDVAEAVQLHFEEELRRLGLAGTWLLSGDAVVADLTHRIRTVDLAVLGLGDPASGFSQLQGFRPEEVVLGCGRPVLGLPVANLPETLGRNVLVAWDGSRPACRAMNDALPLLAEAEAVTVLSIGPAPVTAEAAAAHLGRHGVSASAHEIADAGMEVGALLLAQAEHLRVDLVVAGAYGHSRLREAVLGGASRSLLHQMAVPVLVSH
jgi:nucleotide-binding universal stress UspA family protein